MTTIRVARRDRYTAIDRAALNDQQLSYRARGILVWLLDKPDDWKTTADLIATNGKEGRDAVRSALKELEAVGYLERRKWRNEEGQWESEWTVLERPKRTKPERESSAGQPPRVSRPQVTKTDTDNGTPRSADAEAQAPTLDGIQPPAPSQRAADPVVAEAHALTERVFANRRPKPMPKFLNVRALAVKALRAEWTAAEVEAAMMLPGTVFTEAGLETARAKGLPRDAAVPARPPPRAGDPACPRCHGSGEVPRGGFYGPCACVDDRPLVEADGG